MLLSAAITPQTTAGHRCNLLYCPNHHNHNHQHKLLLHHHTTCRATNSSISAHKPPLPRTASSSSLANNATASEHSAPNPNLHHVSGECVDGSGGGGGEMEPSASAVAWAIRKASTSPVEFRQRIEKDGGKSNLVLPSPEFQRLCLEQLDLFRRIVDRDALLSVYVRPAGSYVMDRLELRRLTLYPGRTEADIAILIATFSVPAGLRAAEAALSSQLAEVIPQCRSVVFPMVKHPFVVGFLVAELPKMEIEREGHDVEQRPSPNEFYALPRYKDSKSWGIQTFEDSPLEMYKYTADQRLNAINISRSLAMAYVMDQKAVLLQQSSWQNNVRMTNLVEQIRGPLSSIRTLSKMLSLHVKRTEISYDIVEDILVQGDRIRDTLQQLQDAVYLTKANIVRYNEETLMKMDHLTHAHPESLKVQLPDNFSKDTSISKMQASGAPHCPTSTYKDLQMPMPPLALAPLQHGIRPCNVSDVLADLVGALEPLARKQRRVVELCELLRSVEVAVEEVDLRQALSNLIEGALLRTNVGGKVEIVSTEAPAAGGALVIIDDDGPDMQYMVKYYLTSYFASLLNRRTQMHSLTPFGVDLFSENMVEDNMAWNFVAGLTVSREILESYGCVIRVISPRIMDAAHEAGGTRIELWLPSFSASPERTMSPS
ncbi:hypothetical protein RJ640_016056 [Escallonia rubra]|uniref:Chloroplast sensor kinase, chloroplastic n=1 Tax=Escallonia rubra TaxID=112253 RepID=A0AA88RBW4_9ASTE|nr:hypothetical protein RJ640_016056 [Escallonia rubra]